MQCLMAEDGTRSQKVLPHDQTDIRVAILHEILPMQATHLFPTSGREGARVRLRLTPSQGYTEVLRGHESRGSAARRTWVGKHRMTGRKDGETGEGLGVCGEIAETEGGDAGETTSVVVAKWEVGDGAVDGGHA